MSEIRVRETPLVRRRMTSPFIKPETLLVMSRKTFFVIKPGDLSVVKPVGLSCQITGRAL
jgi:hypothetical protein